MSSHQRSGPGSAQLSNYLRTFRKRTGLSQADVAYLFGRERGSKISRYERGDRMPQLTTAIGLEIIYGTSLRKLFGGHYEAVERDIAKRARYMLRRYARVNRDQRLTHKLASLSVIAAPRKDNLNQLPVHE